MTQLDDLLSSPSTSPKVQFEGIAAELVVPQTPEERWMKVLFAGTISALLAAIIIFTLFVYLFPSVHPLLLAINETARSSLHPIVMPIGALAAGGAFIYFGGVQSLIEGFSGKPILVVNKKGIDHIAFGYFPWPEVRSVEVINVAILTTEETFYPFRLVATVSSIHRQSARNLLRGSYRFREINGKFVLPIMADQYTKRHPYSINEKWMPPASLDELGQCIRQMNPTNRDMSNGFA